MGEELWVACDRKEEGLLGGRCRNEAGEKGTCIVVSSHKDGTAAVADKPTTILIKFMLFGNVLAVATHLFREIFRFEEECENEHALVAALAKRQFKGVRATGERGDSGTSIFGKGGLTSPDPTTLAKELDENGFTFADIHCFSREPGKGFLVLGYYKQLTDRKPLVLNPDQQVFVQRSWQKQWGKVHVYANIPYYTGVIQGSRFKFTILDERDGEILIHVTKPLMEDAYWIPRKDFERMDKEILHTVNFTGKPSQGPSNKLAYRFGLWGIE